MVYNNTSIAVSLLVSVYITIVCIGDSETCLISKTTSL